MSNKFVVDLDVSKIKPDPKNLRKTFGEEEIVALGHNIKELGQLEPVKVFQNDDGTFDLLDGERRWRAALVAGIPTLKAVIEERPDEATLICKRISRHLQTIGLSKQEEVGAIEEGLEELGIRHVPDKWVAYAGRLGGSFAKIKERMRVADLSPRLREKFESGELPYTIAQSLGRISDAARQEELAEFILSNNLSGRFVTTQFIPRALEHPDLPPMAVYDLARHQERWRYAKPAKKLEVELSISDLTDDLIDTFIKAEKALEEAAANSDIAKIATVPFLRDRLLYSVGRLIQLLSGFMRSYEAHFPQQGEADLQRERGLKVLPPVLEGAPVKSDRSASVSPG